MPESIGRSKRAGWLLEQIEPHGPAAQFRPIHAEVPGHGQPECITVERDRTAKIRDIDVDQQIHDLSVTPFSLCEAPSNRRTADRICQAGTCVVRLERTRT